MFLHLHRNTIVSNISHVYFAVHFFQVIRTQGLLNSFASGFFLFEKYDRGIEEYQSEIFLVGLVREVNPNPNSNPYPISVNINFQKSTDRAFERS